MSTLRYKDTGELHMDFYAAINMTVDYIVNHFGEAALTEIFNRVGKNVYKSIHEGLKDDNPNELIEHLKYYLNREDGEYSLYQNTDSFVLEVKKCPAVEHIRKLGCTLSPHFCRQTIDVNNALCDGTPWQCETKVIAEGVCRQTFSRRHSHNNI